MLKIRDKQMKAFSEYMRRQFEDRMATHLRRTFPQATSGMTDAALLSLIREGIERADTYGIKRTTDVQTFLEFVACYGLNFDSDPSTAWAGRVLRDRTRNPSEKMYLLHQLRRERGGGE
ncbi:MAG: hypothetical protein FJ117_02190 [Deltaproteobacteria bacterium]|nr:hypothetical protein [Deltaproteobacteria bacterium]